jgi:hypothetical protein
VSAVGVRWRGAARIAIASTFLLSCQANVAPSASPASAGCTPSPSSTQGSPGSTDALSVTAGYRWTKSALEAPNSGVTRIQTGSRGFAASGFSNNNSIGRLSPDGITWTLTEAFGRESDFNVGHGIVQSDHGYIAYGSNGGGGPLDFGDARFWGSADGTTWRALPQPASDKQSQIEDVIVTPRLVALGHRPGASSIGPSGTRLFTSADGESWSPLPDPPELATVEPSRLASNGESFVLVGEEHGQLTLHHSTDLSSWAKVGCSELLATRMADVDVASIASDNSGFVLAAYVSNEYPADTAGGTGAIWSSKNGREWNSVELDAALRARPLYDVFPLPDGGFIGLGGTYCNPLLVNASCPGDFSVFSSRDGLQWVEHQDPALNGLAFAVAAGPSSVVIGGSSAIWTGTPQP